MRHTEGSETGLVLVFGVRIAWVQRRVLLEKPDSGVIEGYQQPGVRVAVNIDAEIATGTCVARGISRVVRKLTLPMLDDQPGLHVRHVVETGRIHAHRPVHRIRAIGEWLEEKLRYVRP